MLFTMEDQIINLRIHHFFDIIRAFHDIEKIKPHPYGHSFYQVAKTIMNNPEITIRLTSNCDDVCLNCEKLSNKHCIDKINHRSDFVSKEKFNNYIDERAMRIMGYREGETVPITVLCEKSDNFIDNIDYIFEGNDQWHNDQRKIDIKKGLKYYLSRHKIKI